MKVLAIVAILSLSANFAFAECTDYFQAFNKHQLIIKGIMDLNSEGRMNSKIGDAIGKRLQEAQKPLDAGEYNKACEMYDSIIVDYGFDTSSGPDTKETEQENTEKTETSTEASATSSSGAASSAADSEEAKEQAFSNKLLVL